ncbi:MAG: YqaE/Pmp3 family membrane protein [Chlorobium sp.]
MDIRRWILAFILPPAAVTNKEAGTIMLTAILTLFGWVPGVTFALFLMLQEKRSMAA